MKSSRREFLGTATIAAGVWPTQIPTLRERLLLADGEASPRAESPDDVINVVQSRYCGWPTVARKPTGELWVVYSGGRERHVCPFGRVELIRSHDDGVSWTWPQVMLDSPIDDRDSGICVTAQGTLLVTSFTSLAYEAELSRLKKQADGDDRQRLQQWLRAHERVDANGRKAALGVWMTRSTDNGLTWGRRYDPLVNSPHGPIQLSDGQLLYAGKDLWRPKTRVGVCTSQDDGQTWQWLAEIPPRQGDSAEQYHELHAVQTKTGKLLVHIRNHNAANNNETLQSESSDGGKTWSVPRAIGVWGLPSHLLKLSDGRLLMSYGYRREPFGNQARVSVDEGETWSGPISISVDGAGGDLGYPSTVQLADGALLSVWYEHLADNPFAVLRQRRWHIDD